jgi:hypothetical protein
MAAIIEPLNPSDVLGLGLTPTPATYLDVYDYTTNDVPQLKEAAIEKYNNTITGFINKFAVTETLKGPKVYWAEQEKRAVTYEDAIVTIAADVITLTRADSAKVSYRKNEKIQIYTSEGPGVFICLADSTGTSVVLGSWDEAAVALVDGYTAAWTGVYVYSLGLIAKIGSEGSDYEKGVEIPYSINSVKPVIKREQYAKNGSAPLELKWVNINGQYRWYMVEIDATRERHLESVEKELMEGNAPDAASDAAALGLTSTQGVFGQIEDRGAGWSGLVSTQGHLEAIIKRLNKVQGSKTNLFLCDQAQEFAFDTLARTYNASYGSTGVLDNYIGEYQNAPDGKMIKLSFKGFEYGGYTALKQGWKYLKEDTFRGNAKIVAADRINFLMVPMGMTTVKDAVDADLAENAPTLMRSYMTKYAAGGRDYATQVTGGFNTLAGANNTADDKFKVSFISEVAIAVHNAEKFILGKGV